MPTWVPDSGSSVNSLLIVWTSPLALNQLLLCPLDSIAGNFLFSGVFGPANILSSVSTIALFQKLSARTTCLQPKRVRTMSTLGRGRHLGIYSWYVLHTLIREFCSIKYKPANDHLLQKSH